MQLSLFSLSVNDKNGSIKNFKIFYLKSIIKTVWLINDFLWYISMTFSSEYSIVKSYTLLLGVLIKYE